MSQLNDKEKMLLDKIEEKYTAFKKESDNNMLKTREELEFRIHEIKSLIENSKIDNEKINVFNNDLDKIKKITDHVSEEMTKIKQNGIEQKPKTLQTFLKNLFNTENFKSWVDRGARGEAPIENIKGVVDITNDYTAGTSLITSMKRGPVVTSPDRLTHIRDVINVMPTDMPVHTYDEEYDWSDASEVAGENDTLAESSFKIREATVSTVRIGTFINVSKRLLKAVNWLSAHLASRIPMKILRKEDREILWGDGSSNHLQGVMENASNFNTIVNTGASFSSGAFSTVATWASGSQALITFAADHSLQDGDKLTIANSSNYNATYNIIWYSSTQIIIDATYNAESTAAWTATKVNPFKQFKEEAQEFDVLAVAIALQRRSNYIANGIVLNQVDATKIELLKDANGQYIDGIMRENGILRILGVPVIENDSMPAGRFVVGNWTEAIELLEFTSLNVLVRDDVTYAKANQVAVIAEEEILLPIYNNLNFIQGTFSTAITAINKP